ncbi:hypothetical protein [Aeoliella sp.]|uniref:hypothetical protein n=1 Tax=Aeoliella sp. TaxID=2795800 RepID=UPI003CCC00A4
MTSKWLWWGIGCALFVVAALAIRSGCEHARQEALAKAKARELQSAQEAVEEGRASQDVYVSCQEIIPAIAADEACCKNIQSLYFWLLDMDYDPNFDYSPIQKLENLREIHFYCTYSEDVLKAAEGMESIEELGFELSGPSLEGIDLLASFPNLKKVTFEQVMSREEIDKLEATLPGVELGITATEESEAAIRDAASSR